MVMTEGNGRFFNFNIEMEKTLGTYLTGSMGAASEMLLFTGEFK